MGATRTVHVPREDLPDAMSELGMKEGFDVGLEMSGSPRALAEWSPLKLQTNTSAVTARSSGQVCRHTCDSASSTTPATRNSAEAARSRVEKGNFIIMCLLTQGTCHAGRKLRWVSKRSEQKGCLLNMPLSSARFSS